MFRTVFAGFIGAVPAVGLFIAADAPQENAAKKETRRVVGIARLGARQAEMT
jgi:hypothetical protein